MNIILSNHAKIRMNQRGVSETEIKYVLENPIYTKKGFEDRNKMFSLWF